MKIKTILEDTYEKWKKGTMSLRQAAETFYEAGFYNFVDEEGTNKMLENLDPSMFHGGMEVNF